MFRLCCLAMASAALWALFLTLGAFIREATSKTLTGHLDSILMKTKCLRMYLIVTLIC